MTICALSIWLCHWNKLVMVVIIGLILLLLYVSLKQ